MIPCLLAASLMFAGPGYHERVARGIVSAPTSGIQDYRTRPSLSDEERRALQTVVAEFERSGYRLLIVLVDAGPRFSLGDFTSRAWRLTRGASRDVLVMAASTGVHAQAPWSSYAQVRRMARAVADDYRSRPVETLAVFARAVLAEGRLRARHRRVMLGLAAAAGAGFVGVFAVSLARRRRRTSEANSGATAG